ncbi:MAG: hypothetical protein JW724_08255 [Candidatus Altiarchaeota archaeon]|nr:hypothetical protein [Candidatus Altiarchaeota archaeon]
MKNVLAVIAGLTAFVSGNAQLVGSYTITVTETVSGNQHTERVGITREQDNYMFHRAIGDTVTIEEGMKTGDLYCFREFKVDGSITICKVDGDVLYGYSLTSMGFFFSFTSGEENPMIPDLLDYTGIYYARGGEGPNQEYESVYNIFPGDGDYWTEQDFNGDENPEISGFGFAVEGVLVVAAEPLDVAESWTLACYEFNEDGNAQGRWMTRVVIGSEGYVEESSGWEDLEFIQGFDN